MDPAAYEVSVDIQIRNYHGGNNLALRESVTVGALDFMGMAKLLEGFHAVVTAIKEAQENV